MFLGTYSVPGAVLNPLLHYISFNFNHHTKKALILPFPRRINKGRESILLGVVHTVRCEFICFILIFKLKVLG